MTEYKANKPAPSEDLQRIAEHLAEQPEKIDRDFLGEYLYWSWRCLLYVLAMVLLLSISSAGRIFGCGAKTYLSDFGDSGDGCYWPKGAVQVF